MTRFVGSYVLDARPDRIDLRDRPYTPPLKSLPSQYPSEELVGRFFPLYLEHDMVLQQGKEGACTGFGLACTINYLLWRDGMEEGKVKPPSKVSPRMLYHLARFYDEWPGEDYQGSSCRGAVKAWHKHGVCSNEFWPYRDQRQRVRFIKPRQHWDQNAAQRPLGVYYRIDKQSIIDMQAAINEVGAIYVSAQVHKGWNMAMFEAETISHDTLPEITWQSGQPAQGAHAFALVGYSARGFIIQNSWGKHWGYRGFAILTYSDWVENGSDAWACVMGVPTRRRVDSHYLSSSINREQLLAESQRTALAGLGRPQVKHDYQNPAVEPWEMATAYQHSVFMGNDGRVLNRLVTCRNGKDAVENVVIEAPKRFFKELPGDVKPRLVLYAHGGLNSEGDSIRRIRTLAPYFMANNIYPVFFSWKTGLIESILAIMEDAVGRLFPRTEGLDDLLREAREMMSDALDRTLEVACENLGVKAIWSQMKQNAAESARSEGDRGAFLTVQALAKLRQDIPELEIHLVGHSAGSILLGHMLDDLRRKDIQIASCTLYAAACSVEFANRHYVRAVEKGLLRKQDLHLHMLSDRRERDDTVGPYRKSLLYLVSRALEDWHKTPLLGMERSFDPAMNDDWSSKTRKQVKNWQAFWGQSKTLLLDDEQVVTAAQWKGGRIQRSLAQIDSAHGSFDNDVVVVDRTIQQILGGQPLKHAVENLRY